MIKVYQHLMTEFLLLIVMM